MNATIAIRGASAPRADRRAPASVDAVAVAQPGDRLDAAWTALAAEASEPNPFAEAWFVRPGLEHLAPDGVRLLELQDAGHLLGLLPVTLAERYGRAPIRHVQNWRHGNDFLGTPLVRAGRESEFWAAVLARLDGARWAPGFLHIDGLVEDGPVHRGLIEAARALGRPAPTVHRSKRALLDSRATPEGYYADTVRKKKRKELGRLARRLADLGEVTSATLSDAGDLTAWCDLFLALEDRGWKGRAGSSLASDPATAAFFRAAMAGAAAAGRLDFRRLDLDGAPVAMLISFVTPPGAFSFKTAFDESFARFSPGVLIQLDNLGLMTREEIDWIDSCAAEGHPMIDSLWGERRGIVRVSVPLSGVRRRLVFGVARGLEMASGRLRAIGRKG